jgi:hypothetical protein
MRTVENDMTDIPDSMFKNAKAKALYARMNKQQKQEKESKEFDPNYALPNIISAVAARHPSINYSNIWELTVYQLLDSFERLRAGAIYEIDKTRASVWGDENNVFHLDTWFKNEYDKKND